MLIKHLNLYNCGEIKKMNYEISAMLNPVGSYYFCLLLQKYGFTLYRFNTLTGEYGANLNKDNKSLIDIASLLCNEQDDGMTVIKAHYSSNDDYPSNYLDLIKRLRESQFVRSFTVRYQN